MPWSLMTCGIDRWTDIGSPVYWPGRPRFMVRSFSGRLTTLDMLSINSAEG